jgi:hypothetical protein
MERPSLSSKYHFLQQKIAFSTEKDVFSSNTLLKRLKSRSKAVAV